MPKYGVDITLYCQLIEATDKTDLDTKINAYLTALADTPDHSITWEVVDWDIVEEYPEEEN